jgi:hypothetical protein
MVSFMLRRSKIATVSALVISFCTIDASARKARVPVPGGVPSWDVTASCRGADSAVYNQPPGERLKSCLATEQRTREELNEKWSTFPAADRINCVKSLTFSPTYTELVTCLEMRRDVRNLGGAKPADIRPRR